MTNRNAPAAETGINPKLIALAAKIDEVKAHWRSLSDRVKGADDVRAADHIAGLAFHKNLRLAHRLAAIVAVSMEEM